LTPTTGNLYRVQVGPYQDGKAADSAKQALEREGFKAITKR
jgi:cell division protein FtsN